MNSITLSNENGLTIIRGLTKEDLDLDKTFNCGQCFRWQQIEKSIYQGVLNDKLTLITSSVLENGEYIIATTYPYNDLQDIIDYFNLRLDYDELLKLIKLDDFAYKAVQYGKGIRILHQDLWETIITFIISQRNRVERIANSVELLANTFGSKATLELNNKKYESYKFPRPEEVYKDKEKLFDLGLGYRAEYIYNLVCDIVEKRNNILERKTSKLSTAELDMILQSVKGIGPKVSNCILLFGYNRYDAFPKDTWIKKIEDTIYGRDINPSVYGNYAGLIQQYMFYYMKYLS